MKKMLEDDLLKQIYYGKIYLSEKIPDTPEYRTVMKKIRILSDKLRSEKRIEKCFDEYCEIVSEKESIETEMQFELGFKMAVRLIIYGLQNKDDFD